MGVLQACFNYYGMPAPNIEYACTLRIARKVWKDFEHQKLTFLADKFGIEYDAHNALDDARTCGKIFSMAAEKSKCSTEELFSKYRICYFPSMKTTL